MNKFWTRVYAWAEARLTSGITIWSFIVPGASFVLPAWAARASDVLSQYAPLSWVVCGFAGLLTYVLCAAIYGFAQGKIVRARYDAKFLAETGGVDPLAKVFQGKRIYLQDFILPSNPFVTGKTFVDCEIVGPANVFLETGNAMTDLPQQMIDAVALMDGAKFQNGYTLKHCSFRGCTFHRVTFFWSAQESDMLRQSPYLNWITKVELVAQAPEPTLLEDLKPQPSEDTEAETPPKSPHD